MQAERHPKGDKIVSPFAQSEAAISPKKKSGIPLAIGIAAVVLLLIAGLAGGIVISRYLRDSYRTLEVFPVTKYLDDAHSLYGSKFKAELRVESDLGWKEGIGRLMLFSMTSDPRPLAVMVPAAVGKDIYFTKGQTYMAEFEVKEGGLIYATACRKN